jgi:acetyl-CoA decarbonylase/synthase complex subunit alpha
MSKSERIKNEINRIIKADDDWEPIGNTPMPNVTDLRNWDFRLLKTYEPFYAPFCDLCCLCTSGKCDLTEDRRGACGINMSAQQARMVLIQCYMGAAAHGAHARHLVDYLIDKHGEDYPIDLGNEIVVEAPIIRTVMGLKPKTLKDLEECISYVERELIHLVSSTHMGQEGHYMDYESKAYHAGLMDHVALETCDIAQIVGFGYPSSIAETPLVELGWGTIDRKKPVIVVVGHNAASSVAITDYLRKNDLMDKVELAGICCAALDTTRYNDQAKVVGPLSHQRFFLKNGFADVIVTDEQCVIADIPILAKDTGAALIAWSDKICFGLENTTEKDADTIVDMILEEKKQVLCLDPEKAAEVAVRVALVIGAQRTKEPMTADQVIALAGRCRKSCQKCNQGCVNLLAVNEAVAAAAEGDLTPLSKLWLKCVGCGKCDEACDFNIPVQKMMAAAAAQEKYKVRVGRGPVFDVEIRRVGAPIVLGTIPGVVLFAGCSNYPQEIAEVAWMAEELAKRKYIVCMSGCSAMAGGMYKDENGLTIYEKFPPQFDAGCILNLGSCVSNCHAVGAAIKISNIFAKLPIRANYELIADYNLNRVGACAVVWGPYSQKALAIGTGANRWGIPLVLGPHGAKYKRLFMSKKEHGDWTVVDGRTEQFVDVQEPSPEHLAIVVESRERALITIIKQCMRRNDTSMGRGIKLHHYISVYKQYMGTLPDDLQNFVREQRDIPLVFKKEVMAYLKSVDWKPKNALSLPTIIGTYETKVPISDTVKSDDM